MRFRLSVLILAGVALPAFAEPPTESDTPTAGELARIMRPLLLSALPDPVFDK